MKNTSIILALLLCTNAYSQKKNESVSTWNSHGGDDSEIPADSYNYFKKGKIYYYISNDNENIYLSVKVEDPEIQNKILKQGMIIWVNPDGKQLQRTGIRYPVGSQVKGRPGIGNKIEISPGVNPNSPISQATTIELVGFTDEKVNRFPANNADNFRGSVRYNDDGILLYRLVMPLARLKTISSKDETEQIKYTLGIEPGPAMSGMRPPSQQGQQPQSGSAIPARAGGGRAGGGGGRPSGGGMPGGGPSGGSPSMQPAEANIILWIKDIRLATIQ